MLEDEQGFRQRVFVVMPRVFFVMLPVFAAIKRVVLRGRNFPVALILPCTFMPSRSLCSRFVGVEVHR